MTVKTYLEGVVAHSGHSKLNDSLRSKHESLMAWRDRIQEGAKVLLEDPSAFAWQPIPTAPTDDRPFLVAWDDPTQQTHEYMATTREFLDMMEIQPSHWMAFPPLAQRTGKEPK